MLYRDQSTNEEPYSHKAPGPRTPNRDTSSKRRGLQRTHTEQRHLLQKERAPTHAPNRDTSTEKGGNSNAHAR